MKPRKLLLYIFLFVSLQHALAQITNYPRVAFLDPKFKVESVELTNEYSIISVSYTNTRGGFMSPYLFIPLLTFIYDSKDDNNFPTGSKILASACSLGEFKYDQKYQIEKDKTYRFKLYFNHRIPPGVKSITIRGFLNDGYKTTSQCFVCQGIEINNPPIPTYNPKSNWSEVTLKNYFLSNSKDPREGIYERVNSADENKYKLALVKNNDGFDIIYLSSNLSNEFSEGDIKAYLFNTANENIFKAKWIMSDRTIGEDLYITFSELFMKLIWSDGQGEQQYLKLFPTSKGQTPQNRPYASSGTGFLISSKGYIVTNHHVVKAANKIIVRGLNGDFSKGVSARIIIEDINNDIAIIKTDEYQTPTLTEPTYIISNKRVEPGNSIFCLGYPLRATMGEEVKITNGIISSSSGFMGDITSYQISAPVQPGNSGGPLFDDKGNLVGIINAKHSGTENVSYAIKSSYLLNLISSAPQSIELQQINKISTLSLPEKIKSIKKYTYIIETN